VLDHGGDITDLPARSHERRVNFVSQRIAAHLTSG
jgi:hypothetical protein